MALALILLLASGLRAAVLLTTYDVPGDGPAHAIGAYAWSRSPSVRMQGAWLPGFTYLAGGITRVLSYPALAPRLLNCALGVLSVLAIYRVVRRAHDTDTARLSAFLLAVLPLHIGLSASSLTEVSFLLALLIAMSAMLRACERPSPSWTDLLPVIASLAFAELTRYEAWPMSLVFLVYYHWRVRRPKLTLLLALSLMAFPVAWSVGNLRAHGEALLGFSAAVAPPVGVQRVGPITAAATIAGKALSHLGWMVPAAALVGLTLSVRAALRRQLDVGPTWLLLVTAAYWLMLAGFAIARGPGLWDRYLVTGFVLLFPSAAFACVSAIPRRRAWHLAAGGLMIATMLFGYWGRGPGTYVTTRRPTEVLELGTWLRGGPFRDEALLLTSMRWEALYLPLYYPEFVDRSVVASVWVSDAHIRAFLDKRRPRLLITRLEDPVAVARVERLLGTRIDTDRPLHTVGSVRVLELRPPVGQPR